MVVFNENHKRRLLATFRHVDELLAEVLDVLDTSGQGSLFARYIGDASPIQRKVVSDYAARIRATMRAVLEAWKIDLPRPDVSAVWASRTALRCAQIAVDELAPEHMRGYGAITEDAAKDLNGLVSQLLDLLNEMESYLSRGPARDLQVRLRQFERITDEERVLVELERIITAHGLVELRGVLEALVDRLESGHFEIGVFGHVNSGKSSLLNYILKTDLLPVGATPVTAVPLRVMYGTEPRGRVWFMDAAPQIIHPSRLPEFATEHFNPSNMRHVTRINVELPAPLLKDGIVFIDTPGIGSLATGAAESIAYLPRCDLGIVLLNAASAPASEDIALVDALRRAGAAVMVLLGKADLLTPLERARAETYLTEKLENMTGATTPVYPVSVRGRDAALCDYWFEKALLPWLRDHRRLGQMLLRRRLGVLRDATVAALENRAARPRRSEEWQQRSAKAERILCQALAQLDHMRRRRPEDAIRLAHLVEEILDEAAHNTAVIWNQHHEPRTEVTSLLVASLNSRADRAASATIRSLAKIRAELQNALDAAGSAAGAMSGEEDELPHPAGVPEFDGAAIVPRTLLRKPVLAFLGTFVLRHSARKQLGDGLLKGRIGNALELYEGRLESWRVEMLNELRQGFTVRSNIIRAQLNDPPASPAGNTAEEVKKIREDLEKLRQVFEPAAAGAGEGGRKAEIAWSGT